MKKVVSVILAAFLMVSAFAFDVDIRLMPEFNINLGSLSKYSIAGKASLDFTPIYLRERDTVYFSIQGGVSSNTLNSNKQIEDFQVYSAGVAAGYNFRFSDRFSLAPELTFGGWSWPVIPDVLAKNLKSGGNDKPGFSGLYFGGKVAVNYYLLPELTAFAYAGFESYIVPTPIFNNVSLGLGVKYNFKKGLFSVSSIETKEFKSDALFPVFYSRYNDNSFGSVTFINNEPNDITNVEIQILISQYMMTPKTVKTYELIKKGEEFSAELTAFLNENILNSMLSRKADTKIIVNYKSLGKQMSYSQTMEIQALSRNSMSWEDDRRAAAFVSGRDASALKFARQVVSIVKNDINPNKPRNTQYAAALFGALKAYGINYVIDPASAFTDNVGSAAVDFLQFPYQTLLYHGGDCDDLTILNCSLLEALGIPTAFITVPGHIFMAFDSGVALSEADSVIGKGKYINAYDKAWIPVEITVSQDTFSLALSIGLREWKKYGDESVLIPLAEAWKEYKPVSIPESDVSLQMPTRDVILKQFHANY